jgi:hypothetical protein
MGDSTKREIKKSYNSLLMENRVIIYDNIFTKYETEKYRNILKNCPLHYGQKDKIGTKPTGLTSDFADSDDRYSPMLNKILSKIYEKEPLLKNMKLFRTYINLFLPEEIPYFHNDGENTVTCMVYVNPPTDYDEGGETQFILDGEINCVRSIPGRLVIFDGKIEHRATSFRSIPRITLVFKFYI